MYQAIFYCLFTLIADNLLDSGIGRNEEIGEIPVNFDTDRDEISIIMGNTEHGLADSPLHRKLTYVMDICSDPIT